MFMFFLLHYKKKERKKSQTKTYTSLVSNLNVTLCLGLWFLKTSTHLRRHQDCWEERKSEEEVKKNKAPQIFSLMLSWGAWELLGSVSAMKMQGRAGRPIPSLFLIISFQQLTSLHQIPDLITCRDRYSTGSHQKAYLCPVGQGMNALEIFQIIFRFQMSILVPLQFLLKLSSPSKSENVISKSLWRHYRKLWFCRIFQSIETGQSNGLT